MSTEKSLAAGTERSHKPAALSSSRSSFRLSCDAAGLGASVFEELPMATIVSVSRPDVGDITPLLLSYVIEVQYRQFKWRLLKKASQVIYLHLALKKRAIVEEFQEKQEQVKEWLQYIGIGDHTGVMHQGDDSDDEVLHFPHDRSSRHRCVPSSAALPIIRPSLGGQQTVADKAKVAMQGYLNHFLGNLDIVNSREACKFLKVSKLSFEQEYGPKLKEDYLLVKHLPRISRKDDAECLPCPRFCNYNWQKVWAVLKPGFMAFLEDPLDTELLDIIIFDILPFSHKTSEEKVLLAQELKEHNPLWCTFRVSCGNRSIRLRTSSSSKVKDWVCSINDSVQKPPEGWCHPHRYGSFAAPRGSTEDGSEAQWFIDGQAAFDAIASALEKAKSEILITGWWLCPELYLRRPFQDHSSSRLDALLESKAKEGVQIYILLYKEVSIALKINSSYSKRRLLIHENVRVMRYPDHLTTGVYYWSHHEKIVIVDHRICFIGGLDLCFGRYDTVEHKVEDSSCLIWPGKDYYNPRESEPNSWEDMMKDELDRKRYPRMPWHDVHCALWGPPCRDVARHFVQRWNHAKRSKAPNQEAIPLLMPHHHMVIPHYMGRSEAINISGDKMEQKKNLNKHDTVSSRSPSENIPLLLPLDSQVINVDDELDGQMKSHDLVQPIAASETLLPHQSTVKPKGEDLHMEDHGDDLLIPGLETSETSSQMTHSHELSSVEWWESQERGYQDAHVDETAQVGPRTSCNCQIVRSVSQWSAGTNQAEESIHRAYCSLIERAEHFIYIENQFFISGLKGDAIIQNRVLEALFNRILKAHKEKKCFRVIIVLPLIPGFQGGMDDGGAATVRAIMHWQYQTICRGENSILHSLNAAIGPKTFEYISFYGLRAHGRLVESGPRVTSQVYVHSKLMIVDDRIALIGSANINDRSLLGSRDSEIGVVIEDREYVDSSMNGKPWSAGKFSYALRLSLWSEHLGLCAEDICRIHDPVADKTYKDLWMKTAMENTLIYQDVFACVPNDQIHSRATFRQKMSQSREKNGYTTIDLGVAPKVLETQENGKVFSTDPMDRLKSVKGFLVCFPLEFMREEDLRPMFHEGEFYASREKEPEKRKYAMSPAVNPVLHLPSLLKAGVP
ncbi:Phospholipase D zeta 1-like protein [Drosera capensis]